jgi:hypothetical protein
MLWFAALGLCYAAGIPPNAAYGRLAAGRAGQQWWGADVQRSF